MLRARCPHCRIGPIFARWRFPGWGVLLPECPVCGTRYQREAGYFLGAMYISSLIVTFGIFVLLLVFWLLTKWSWDVMLLASIVGVIVLAPLVTSVARVAWLHFDHHVDPQQ
jgi:uncharacterized protein (DUF983 family)